MLVEVNAGGNSARTVDVASSEVGRRLLTTKLFPPRVQSDLVARPRLIDAINRGVERKLTVISTPPGYGKTTLVVQWLAQEDRPVPWVSLDEGDNNPHVFFAYVATALRTFDADIAKQSSRLLDARSPVPVHTIVDVLLNELATVTRPFVLVLDDFHLISAPEILAGIELLLRNLPSMMHIIITSRADPELPLVRMRSRGELQEIRAADLRFTNEEAHELLQEIHKLDLSPSEIEEMENRTEGWAVGLRLVAHAVNGQSRDRVRQVLTEFAGNIRLIGDYLWAEAIEQCTPEVRDFLLRTSILNRFDARLCDAVLDTINSGIAIRSVERANLFLIALDDRGQWYRYHHLWAEVLRDRLAKDLTDDEICELHQRAARWYENHEQPEDALRHAMAGRDWERAVRLLKELCVWLNRQDRLAEQRYWLQGLPPDVLEREPDLCYMLAWSLIRTGNGGAAIAPLEVAEATWHAANDLPNIGAAMILRMFIDYARGDTRGGIARGYRALELLPDDRTQDRAGAYMMLGLFHFFLGELADAESAFVRGRTLAERSATLWLQLIDMVGFGNLLAKRGKLIEATTLYRRVISVGDEWIHQQVQYALWELGSVYYEWNQLDAAESHLRHAVELAERLRSPLHRTSMHENLAKVAWARQDLETAFAEIELALNHALTLGFTQYIRHVRALRTRFWLASNQLGMARRWADENGPDLTMPLDYERQDEYLVVARLLIHEGRDDAVNPLLDRLQHEAEATGRIRDVIEILVLRSLAEQMRNEPEAATHAIERALDLGAAEGFTRTFADEGPRMIPLLRRASHGPRRDYVNRILAAIDVTLSFSAPDQPGLISPLSQREIEVLRLVSSGESNRDIAQRLFISEPTVKKHLSNILGKLAVSNRVQAVDQARRLGLI